MRVLVACEFSGTVRDAFIQRGHDAVSCDIIPSERPGPHIQDDVLDHLSDGWDLMIAFPPCTDLAWSNGGHLIKKRIDGRTIQASEFVKTLRNAPIHRIAIENPKGDLWKSLRKPDQVIEPYMFGDPWKKATCMWLYNLPRLVPTKTVTPTGKWVDCGTKPGQDRGKNRNSRERARTFPGIAAAMATQWGAMR